MITADQIEKEVYFKYGREVAEFIYPMLLELEDDSEERGYCIGLQACNFVEEDGP